MDEYLRSQANDTTSRSAASVTGLEGVGMTALAQVVGAVVDHNGSPENGVGPNQLDQQVLLGALGNAGGVGAHVSHVAHMSLVGFRRTVGLGERVEVGTGRSAAVGVITKLVDVETPLGVRIVTLDLPADNCGRRLGLLFEMHHATNLGVSSQNCDCAVLVNKKKKSKFSPL
jgi:hypothetical protein